MHPNKTFRWNDESAMRAFVAGHSFAHLFAATPEGPMVAHLPLTLAPGRQFRFHLARGNRIAKHLDGAAVIASVTGPDGYISPDWYADGVNQVPSWNYVAVEIEGTAHALTEADLIGQLDVLGHANESKLAPKPEWTRGKVSEVKLRGLYAAIQAFEIRVTAMRGTRKLSQNKRPEDREGAAVGAEAAGNAALAAMRAAE